MSSLTSAGDEARNGRNKIINNRHTFPAFITAPFGRVYARVVNGRVEAVADRATAHCLYFATGKKLGAAAKKTVTGTRGYQLSAAFVRAQAKRGWRPRVPYREQTVLFPDRAVTLRANAQAEAIRAFID